MPLFLLKDPIDGSSLYLGGTLNDCFRVKIDQDGGKLDTLSVIGKYDFYSACIVNDKVYLGSHKSLSVYDKALGRITATPTQLHCQDYPYMMISVDSDHLLIAQSSGLLECLNLIHRETISELKLSFIVCFFLMLSTTSCTLEVEKQSMSTSVEAREASTPWL